MVSCMGHPCNRKDLSMKSIGLVIFCAVLLSGCHDGCSPEEMKCDGSTVMICNDKTDWESVMDCDELEPMDSDLPDAVCCEDPADGYYTCLPAPICEEFWGEDSDTE